jgi:hypothetical protein
MEKLACEDCGKSTLVQRPFLNLFSLTVICPRCGDSKVERLPHRDPIDELYLHPISLLQRLAGAPLYGCAHCRLQFYDFRRRGDSKEGL